MNECMNEWMDGWTNGWMDGWIYDVLPLECFHMNVIVKEIIEIK